MAIHHYFKIRSPFSERAEGCPDAAPDEGTRGRGAGGEEVGEGSACLEEGGGRKEVGVDEWGEGCWGAHPFCSGGD